MVTVANGLSLLDGSSTSGSIRVAGTGQLEFRGDGGILEGTIGNEGSVIFNPLIQNTFAGLITGPGAVIKRGAGILNLEETSTYTGATTVEAGWLVVNGGLASSAVTVNSGAGLGGGGSLADLTILAGGLVAPGNSIGTLTVNGDYRQQGTYQLEYRAPADLTHIVNGELRGRNTLEGATTGQQDADLIHVLGLATLSGGTIELQPLGAQDTYDAAFNATGNTEHRIRYLILRAEEGRSGQLALLSSDGLSRIDYPNATDVEMVIAGNPSDLLIVTAVPAPMLARENAQWQGAVDLTRQRPQCDESFGMLSSGKCGFVQGDFRWSDTASSDSQPSGDSRKGAGLVGFGWQIQPDVWLGVAAGAGGGRLDGGSSSQSSDLTQTSAYLWGQWRPGNLDFRGWLGYVDHSVDGSRLTSKGETARTDYGADQTMAIIEARRWWRLNEGVTFAPMMGLQGTWYRRGSFRETGGGMENFSARSETYDSIQSLLGLEGRWETKAASLPLQLETHLGWVHEFGDTAATVNGVYLSAPETTFTNSGVAVGRDQLRFIARIGLPAGPGVVSLGYEGNYGSNLTAHGAMARFTLPF